MTQTKQPVEKPNEGSLAFLLRTLTPEQMEAMRIVSKFERQLLLTEVGEKVIGRDEPDHYSTQEVDIGYMRNQMRKEQRKSLTEMEGE